MIHFLKDWGWIAGIAGIGVGAFVLLFREVIRKEIFPQLTKKQGFQIILIFLFLVWSVAIASLALYFKLNYEPETVTGVQELPSALPAKTEDSLVSPDQPSPSLQPDSGFAVNKKNGTKEANEEKTENRDSIPSTIVKRAIQKIPITLCTKPPGALIYLNDTLLCRSNQTVVLEKGRHRIRVEKLGYSTIEDFIYVEREKQVFTYPLDD